MKLRYCILFGLGLGLSAGSILRLFDSFSLKFLILMFIGIIICIIVKPLIKKH